MTKSLLCVLIGVLLASGAFLVRDAVTSFHGLEDRVSAIEGFLTALQQMRQQSR